MYFCTLDWIYGSIIQKSQFSFFIHSSSHPTPSLNPPIYPSISIFVWRCMHAYVHIFRSHVFAHKNHTTYVQIIWKLSSDKVWNCVYTIRKYVPLFLSLYMSRIHTYYIHIYIHISFIHSFDLCAGSATCAHGTGRYDILNE